MVVFFFSDVFISAYAAPLWPVSGGRKVLDFHMGLILRSLVRARQLDHHPLTLRFPMLDAFAHIQAHLRRATRDTRLQISLCPARLRLTLTLL